jgi:hypothetical protein
MHSTLGTIRLSTRQLTSIFLLSHLSDPKSAAGSSRSRLTRYPSSRKSLRLNVLLSSMYVGQSRSICVLM